MTQRNTTRTHAAGSRQFALFLAGIAGAASLMTSGAASALAMAHADTQAAHADASSVSSTGEQARMHAIIAAGEREITRRLTTLNTLASKINGATKLSASDKATLLSEVNTEIGGLTALKAKLAAETTFAGAKADANSIHTDYRVYALVVPKVQLLRVADDQLVVEAKLTDLIAKLQVRITIAQGKGKDTASLQTKLNAMKTQLANAQAISAAVQAKVLPLQPGDFNSDHAVLSGDASQLKTAHDYNASTYKDAKSIVNELKNL